MTITKTVNGSETILALEGRLDTGTSGELERAVKAAFDGCTTLIFDLNGLIYVSSAGLRVLLMSQKTMNKQGSMIIRNVNESVMEIFDVTGFVDFLTIE